MNKYYRPTIVFIVAVVGLVTLYDIWAVAHGYDKTVSSNLAIAGHQWPIIPLLVGILIGHLWFPNRATGADPTPEQKQ